MNGRTYDPLLARFMQPDPLIQDMLQLQNYDRYAYCMNSPLVCTDPSGYSWLSKTWKKFWHNPKLRMVASIAIMVYLGPAATSFSWEAMRQAAMAGFASGAVASGNLKGGLQGAFSAAVFYGVGTSLQGMNLDVAAKFAAGVSMHAVAGCVTSVAGGGKCGPGALSAAFAKAATLSGFMDDINNAAATDYGARAGGTIINAIVGGAASVLGGGKFANGAQTGAFSYLFNQVATNRAAGVRFENAVVQDLIDAGYQVARNVEIKFTTAGGHGQVRVVGAHSCITLPDARCRTSSWSRPCLLGRRRFMTRLFLERTLRSNQVLLRAPASAPRFTSLLQSVSKW